MDSTSLGTGSVAGRAVGMEVFPDPASDEVNVVFASDGAMQLLVFDARGRQVATAGPSTPGAGVHRVHLSVQDYASGLYTVIAVSRDGRRGQVRFIVEH
jgi:hypothetical protein